jgi:predicted ribosomally synthesized peptide with nif11-like leader
MEQIKLFIEKAKSDSALMAKLNALDAKNAGANEVIALAAEYGFSVTNEDVEVARRQNCPHHGELSEKDLDAVSGGITQNRHNSDYCRNLDRPLSYCKSYQMLFIPSWCDHYREDSLGNGRYHYACAMGAFDYYGDAHGNP